MNIFAVIVTYNAESLIFECLKTLKLSSVVPSIVVVDNNSEDKTIEIIKTNFPEIILIELTRNEGFGKANNVGIDFALNNGAEYVFLINQDAFVDENCLHYLIKEASKNSDYGIISPVHLNYNSSELDFNWVNYYLTEKRTPGFVSDAYLNNPKELYETAFVNAAAWLVSKECLRAVGGFNPLFFMYGEDDDYCNRLHFKKLKIGIVYQAKIRHLRSNTNSKVVKQTIATKKKNIERHYFLSKKIALLNPEKRFIQSYFNSSLKSIYKGVIELLRFNIVLSYLYFRIALKIVFAYFSFSNNRKQFFQDSYPFLSYKDKFVK